MRRSTLAVSLSLAAAIALATACAAFGATTVGSVAPPGTTTATGYNNVLEFQHSDGGGSPTYATPSAGVVTSFSLRTGNAVTPGDSVQLSVVRNYPDPPYESLVAKADQQMLLGTANTVLSFPVRLPVLAGDRFGYVINTNTGTAPYFPAGISYGGNEIYEFIPAPAVGSPVTSSSPNFQTVHTLYLMNLSLNVEPDADQDGYGDETQDACPTDASTHGPCNSTAPALDRTAPVITGFKATQKRFRIKTHGAVITKRAHAGATIGLSLSEAAKVTFAISQQTTGRRVGGVCTRATHKNHKAKHCVRLVEINSFTRSLEAGANSFAFSGRYEKSTKVRSLKLGRYDMTATPLDVAGNTGLPAKLSFKIVR